MGITAELADYICSREFQDLSPETVDVGKHCLLDFVGVTVAGASEPLVGIIRDQAAEEGGSPQASVLGGGFRATVAQAALINGAASHAHDYDDVHPAMSGHPTVPVAPAVLALAEHQGVSGEELLLALVTGIDSECLVGRYVGGSHYGRGFHATGTLGSLGAAAACSRLLRLDPMQTRHAIGIAATQAAGLKSMFGSMCKPLHAGKAAANGLLAAQLASRGFSANPDSLEVDQGFGKTHADSPSDTHFREAIGGTSFVPTTLFKYHAACYLTHSALEAAKYLRDEEGVEATRVDSATITVNEGHFSVCNIQNPASGLEAKFSIRFATAMVLADIDTARIGEFSDEVTRRPELTALRDRIEVAAFPERGHPESVLEVRTTDGDLHRREWNVAIPEADLPHQWQKLTGKFHSLVDPVVGQAGAARLIETIDSMEREESLEGFFSLVRT